jgi:hypothetical protein
MHRNVFLKFVDKGSAAVTNLVRVSPSDAMHKLCTVMAEIVISTSPKLCRIAVNSSSTVWRLRSASMMTLESRTNPRTADSMTAGDL